MSDSVAMECDVLVIGGGPAGATAAALLAERGRHVVMLEKSRHPRFHIGESLLPANMAVIERLGLREKVSAIGLFKPGAEFVSDEHGGCVAFSFAAGIDKRHTHAFHVRRADFDLVLFENARGRGADCAEETRVTEIAFASPGGRAAVTAERENGTVVQYAPRFVLDASGRDTFLAGRLGTKESNKDNNTAAVFGHFRGAECRTGDLSGYITVHLVADGWFWMIPLPDNLMSVGFVGSPAAFKDRPAGTMKDFLFERIRKSASVAARMACAELIGDVTSTGNYSYKARSAVGQGYMMIGDAFGFLDPIFSSGVLLAMNSGETASDVVDTWLDDEAAGMTLARQAETRVCGAMKTLSWLITRINSPVLRDMFMSPHNRFRMREGLVSLLAGNVHGKSTLRLPVMAFKAAFYMLSLFHRFGYRLHPEGRIVPKSRWAAMAAARPQAATA